tara:strand:- start:2035 stop:2712 length:678 start_codon:yes stop_codon:yes gene_type:complete
MILVPTTGPSDWQRLLAEPGKQWKTGYSARSIAYCWEAADGLPAEIAALFENSTDFDDGSPEVLIAVPEWKVPLPGGARDSQNDVFVLARSGEQTISMTVEGKVNEAFGPTLDDWFSLATPGKTKRLAYLRQILGLPESLPGNLHYQLLHRTGSAVIEANRFGTTAAAMIVHSFSPEKKWFDAYALFVELMGGVQVSGELVAANLPGGRPLYLGWAVGDPKFLSA